MTSKLISQVMRISEALWNNEVIQEIKFRTPCLMQLVGSAYSLSNAIIETYIKNGNCVVEEINGLNLEHCLNNRDLLYSMDTYSFGPIKREIPFAMFFSDAIKYLSLSLCLYVSVSLCLTLILSLCLNLRLSLSLIFSLACLVACMFVCG